MNAFDKTYRKILKSIIKEDEDSTDTPIEVRLRTPNETKEEFEDWLNDERTNVGDLDVKYENDGSEPIILIRSGSGNISEIVDFVRSQWDTGTDDANLKKDFAGAIIGDRDASYEEIFG